ncbi:MAG: carbohydrate ABC transporter permease [Caldicoprobacterales bacterium]
MKKAKVYRYINIVLLTALLALILVPIYWTISMSFDEDVLTEVPNPPRLIPSTLSWRNYKYAFNAIPLVRYFRNTLFLTVINTLVSVFFALSCGYAFAKGQFFLKNFWFLFMLAVMMIPFESIMVSLFLQYQRWSLLDTYWPLMLGSFAYVFGAFLARQNISQIPDSLREAAFIDGASEWRTFLTIIIPLSGPVIATMCILQILSHWNSFLWPLIIISSREKHVISVGVSMFNASESARYLGPRMSVAVVSALPIVVMFLFLQKHIVSSIALSGIKQ